MSHPWFENLDSLTPIKPTKQAPESGVEKFCLTEADLSDVEETDLNLIKTNSKEFDEFKVDLMRESIRTSVSSMNTSGKNTSGKNTSGKAEKP